MKMFSLIANGQFIARGDERLIELFNMLSVGNVAGARETVFEFPCKLGVLEKKNPLVLNYGGAGVVFGTVGDGHQTSLAALQFKINQRDQSIIPEQELDRSSFYRLVSNAEQEACALNSGSIGVIKNPDGAGHLFMEMGLIKLLFEKEPVLAEISRRFPNKSIASLHDAVEIVLANLPKGICISDNVLFRLHKDNSVISYEFLTGEGRNIATWIPGMSSAPQMYVGFDGLGREIVAENFLSRSIEPYICLAMGRQWLREFAAINGEVIYSSALGSMPYPWRPHFEDEASYRGHLPVRQIVDSMPLPLVEFACPVMDSVHEAVPCDAGAVPEAPAA